jgi:hypothetical protein
MTEKTVQIGRRDMLFLVWIVAAALVGFTGFAVGVTVFPRTVTTTNYSTITSTQSTTTTRRETASIYVTMMMTTTFAGYGATQPNYGGMVYVTFVKYSWNTSIDLVAIAVDPSTGSSSSVAFQRDPNINSQYIPYTYRATLYVRSGQTYWLIVKYGYTGPSDYIFMQLVYIVPDMQPIVIQ